MRLSAEEAALIEEAAGETPLMIYIHHVLNDRARYHIRMANKKFEPLVEEDEELDNCEEGGVK